MIPGETTPVLVPRFRAVETFSCFNAHFSEHPVHPNVENVLARDPDLPRPWLRAGSHRMNSHRGKRSYIPYHPPGTCVSRILAPGFSTPSSSTIELPSGIVKSYAYSPDIVRDIARLHKLRCTTRLSATAAAVSSYINLPESPN